MTKIILSISTNLPTNDTLRPLHLPSFHTFDFVVVIIRIQLTNMTLFIPIWIEHTISLA